MEMLSPIREGAQDRAAAEAAAGGCCRDRSALYDHYFEVLGRRDQGRVAADVEFGGEVEDVLLEPGLAVGRQRGEGLVHGPVPGAEHVDEMLRRPVAEGELAGGRVDRR